MEILTWILLIVFVLLDLFMSITRASLFNARLPQLIDLGTEDEERLERTIKVLETSRMRATMRFLVSMFHALVLACVWVLIEGTEQEYSLAAMLGWFALTLVVLLGFEFLAERFPLKNPETWAMALAPSRNAIRPCAVRTAGCPGTDSPRLNWSGRTAATVFWCTSGPSICLEAGSEPSVGR